jgi:2-polyprenyl-3-methyl-5-hydroxy-6-metoxy-1,4-benzoquinol methylase
MVADAPCPGCGGTDVEPAAENPAHTVNTGPQVFSSRICNVLCRVCGLIFNDPMPTEEELAELYQAMARDVSDRPDAAAARIMPIEAAQAAFVWRALERGARARQGSAGGWSVLDIGCSMGGFLAAMAGRGARTAGVEPSPHDAAVARERFGVDVRGAFFEQVDFGAERFDVIALRFVFEHVREPRAVVRRARTLLADGGLLFIEVPNLVTPFVGFDDFFSFGHLQTFTPETLIALCAREGWSPVAVEESRNLFDSSPHPPSIRALFAPGDPAASPAADPQAVRAHLARYQAARDGFVARARERLLEASRGSARIVIYGAGTHTAELWRECPFLAGRTIAMVDGNPRLQGHTFLGVPVRSPRDLAGLDPDVVVVSVRTAEPQIAGFLAQQGLADRTVRLYDQAGVVAA